MPRLAFSLLESASTPRSLLVSSLLRSSSRASAAAATTASSVEAGPSRLPSPPRPPAFPSIAPLPSRRSAQLLSPAFIALASRPTCRRPLPRPPLDARSLSHSRYYSAIVLSTGQHLPLPPGYTPYPLHGPASPREPWETLDMRIYTSPTPDPPLPRSSTYQYLFPPDPAKAAYPVPPPDTPAFIDGHTGRTVTRGDLDVQARRLAGGLQRLGVKQGDRAAIFGMNSLEYINALLGSQAALLVVSPCNFGYTPPELAHQLSDSGASIIFVQPILLPVLQQALELLPPASRPGPDHIVLLSTKADKPKDAQHKCTEELWAAEPVDVPALPAGRESDTAYLCYSSGTTGRAKGVETSHHNMTSQVQAFNTTCEPLQRGKDVILGILPFGHIYGLTCLLHHPLVRGVPVVVLPRFEEHGVLAAIERFRITWGLVVPPVMLVLLNSTHVAKHDLSSLRGVQSGAAPLSAELCQRFYKQLGIRATQGYGLTETSPVTHVMTSGEGMAHAGSVGKLIPTYQARLVDPKTGKDVDRPGGEGELWVRGPSVMKGYWRDADATRAAFAPDGWFKTGDVAVVDDDGFWSVVDRVKELIKYKGYQVPPAELEALLLQHPDVVDAAVIGIYVRAQATELPRAYVVPTAAKRAELQGATKLQLENFQNGIASWVAKRVAGHKRLRGGVHVIPAVPKSPSGKILRKVLRDQAAKEMEDARERDKVRGVIGRGPGGKEVRPTKVKPARAKL